MFPGRFLHTCPSGRAALRELSTRTQLGYRRFVCGGCGRTLNERSGTPFNRLALPTDVVAAAVRWHRDDGSSLRKTVQALDERGFDVTHESIRDWVVRFGPLIPMARPAEPWFATAVPVVVAHAPGTLHRALDRHGRLVEFQLLREAQLRRFRDRVWRERGVGRPGDAPASANERAAGAAISVPAPVTVACSPMAMAPLIGRSADLERVAGVFDLGAALVTLVGPPGVGKSRLAAQVGAAHGPALVCDLGAARSRRDAMAMLAARAGIAGVGASLPADVVASIARALAAAGVRLVILDHAERVLGEVTADILGCLSIWPGGRFLVASQFPLRVTAETVIELEPLAEDDAITLFELCRGRMVGSRSSVDVDEVRELVCVLDRLPLAIELAAAQAAVRSVAQLLARAGDRLDLFEHQLLDAPEHHASLRTAFDRLWHYLPDEDRNTLAVCSVFCGGFFVEAAAHVLGQSTSETLTRLARLRARRLCRAAPSIEGRMRFSFTETLRLYASERLGEGDERQAVARHARYFADASWRRGCEGRSCIGTACACLAMEAPNIYAAFGRARRGDVDGVRALLALEPLAFDRGAAAPYLQQIERAVELTEDGDAELRCETLLSRSRLRYRSGDIQGALDDLRRIRADVGTTELTPSQSIRLSLEESRCLSQLGRVDEARAHLRDALRQSRELGDLELMAKAEHFVGIELSNRSKWEESRDYLERALASFRLAGSRRHEGIALGNLGLVMSELQCPERAADCYREAIAINREVNNRVFEAVDCERLAFLLSDHGELDRAREYYDFARVIQTELEDWVSLSVNHGNRGVTEHRAGDLARARAELTRARELLVGRGHIRGEAFVLAHLAAIEATTGPVEEARKLLHTARSFAHECRDVRLPIVIETLAGFADLADARSALRNRMPGPAARSFWRAHERLRTAVEAPDSISSVDLRHAVELLRPALARLGAVPDGDATTVRRAMVVAHDASWFSWDGATSMDLTGHERQRALFMRLVGEREDPCSTGVSVWSLFEAGWPGETARPDAAANRVRVALSRLRSLGLKDAFTHNGTGYRLMPDIAVLLADAPHRSPREQPMGSHTSL